MSLYRNRQEALRLAATLTQNERVILALLVNGHSSRSIAAFLSTTVREAERVKQSAMEKLCARTTTDAVRIGILLASHGGLELDQPELRS